MARINVVVSDLSKDSFSGGIWCIFEYAHGLVDRGHDVTIVTTLPSEYPHWFPRPIGRVLISDRTERVRNLFMSALHAGWSAIADRKSFSPNIMEFVKHVFLYKPAMFADPVRGGISEAYAMSTAPEADITIATSYDTVRSASLLTGKKFYFAQHYEPYFATWLANPTYAATVSRQSYHLGFNIIANSSWLLRKLTAEIHDVPISLCTNAIDHSVFYGTPKDKDLSRRAVIISYGGRDAIWKGFRDMADAMSIARAELPACDIEWRVFGDAILPPSSTIPYVPLGFLYPAQLSEEYRDADILLSASWYESFPLFPIEGMACGLPVITTEYGTEDYATDGVTAKIVQARSARSIADGIISLILDRGYRNTIAMGGNDKAQQFRWKQSIDRFEHLLLQS